jgi:hypothetical protein
MALEAQATRGPALPHSVEGAPSVSQMVSPFGRTSSRDAAQSPRAIDRTSPALSRPIRSELPGGWSQASAFDWEE